MVKLPFLQERHGAANLIAEKFLGRF